MLQSLFEDNKCPETGRFSFTDFCLRLRGTKIDSAACGPATLMQWQSYAEEQADRTINLFRKTDAGKRLRPRADSPADQDGAGSGQEQFGHQQDAPGSPRESSSQLAGGTKRTRLGDDQAAANLRGFSIPPEDPSWPLDVQCFLPEFGRAKRAFGFLVLELHELSAELFDYEGLLTELAPECFDAAPFRLSSETLESAPDSEIRAVFSKVLGHMSGLHRQLCETHAAMERAWSIYSLATLTRGASWLTVKQLQHREREDERQRAYGPLANVPILSWAEKVSAALTVCEQANVALTRDGKLAGPIAPEVLASLRRRGEPQGGRRRDRGNGRTDDRGDRGDRRQRKVSSWFRQNKGGTGGGGGGGGGKPNKKSKSQTPKAGKDKDKDAGED